MFEFSKRYNKTSFIVFVMCLFMGRLLLTFIDTNNYLIQLNGWLNTVIAGSTDLQDTPEAETAEINRLREVNDDLRRSLELTQEIDSISAEIIRRDRGLFTSTAYINKGSSHGVTQNSTVTFNDYVVGKVVQVNEDNSIVQMINDPAFKVAVLAENSIPGIVKQTSQGLIIDKLISERDLSGTVASTSGIAGEYTVGIKVGTIEELISSSGSFKKYGLTLPYNPDTITVLEVLK